PSGGGFMWPCPGFYYISSYYGYRWGRNHNGIDVGDAGIHGGAAVASKSGTVIYVANSCTHDYPKSTVGCGCGGNYGNYVLIQHDSTYTTIYAHLASVAVSVGDTVQQGQVIGYIGSTGWSTGDHLHFEIRAHGYAQDPMAYL
ncbi:MAG: M23 family metallopeptidase, partial [Ruminococcus sp.]|nr:M23 family metallopeptidase [Ruminococcus sp.]